MCGHQNSGFSYEGLCGSCFLEKTLLCALFYYDYQYYAISITITITITIGEGLLLCIFAGLDKILLLRHAGPASLHTTPLKPTLKFL